MFLFFFFFFSSRRRHTRLVSDWSSDVCSSDLTCVQSSSPLLLREAACVAHMPCSSLPPWFVLRDAVGGDLPGQKLCVLHAQVRSLLRHIHVWGSVAFLLFC